jgi:hypothetical protein
MSAYPPPIEFFSQFNSSVFYSNTGLSLPFLETQFLTYPIGQSGQQTLTNLLNTNSANFAGTITVPTKTAGDNSVEAANTAFVTTAISNINLSNIPVAGIASGTIYLVGSNNYITGTYQLQTDINGHIFYNTSTNTLTSGVGGTNGSITANGTTGSITGYGTSATALDIPNGGATFGKTGTALSVPNGNITTGGTITATGVVSSPNLLNNQVSSNVTFSNPTTPIIAQTIEPQNLVSTDSINYASGNIIVTNVWINSGKTITNINFFLRTYTATAPALNIFYGLYNNLQVLVGSTNAVTPTSPSVPASDTMRTIPLITPFTTSYSGYYWIAILPTTNNLSQFADKNSGAAGILNFPQITTSTNLTLFNSAVTTVGGITTLPSTLTQTLTPSGRTPLLLLN